MNAYAAIALGSLAAACAALAPFDARAQVRDGFSEDAPALPAARLEALRGGFVLPSGLVMSFGIERTVAVNGVVVASTRFTVPDLSRLTSAQAGELAALRDTMRVQVGEGNALASIPGGPALIVQNTLDTQAIGITTTLDTNVGALGLFQQLNTGAALQSALIGAAGGP